MRVLTGRVVAGRVDLGDEVEELHRDELRADWQLAVDGKPLQWIAPLE